MSHTLDPVEPPYSDTVTSILANYPQRDGYLLKLFRVFANSTRFLTRGTLNLLDRESPLTLRERELVILRTCANNSCEYEWGVHVGAFAKAAGLDEEQVANTAEAQIKPTLWPEEDRLLLDVVDALCAGGSLPDSLKRKFQETWEAARQLEVFALCGNYHTVSFVANVSAVSAEDFAVSFPRGPSLPG